MGPPVLDVVLLQLQSKESDRGTDWNGQDGHWSEITLSLLIAFILHSGNYFYDSISTFRQSLSLNTPVKFLAFAVN